MIQFILSQTKKYSTLSILLATALLMSSCTFWHDTVSFGAAGRMPASGSTRG